MSNSPSALGDHIITKRSSVFYYFYESRRQWSLDRGRIYAELSVLYPGRLICVYRNP